VRCARNQVDLDVENGPPARPQVAGTGGRGLAGMRERVTTLGGSIAAGPTAAGGFRIRLSIPIGDGP
jgi:signal transduction histidine kinase